MNTDNKFAPGEWNISKTAGGDLVIYPDNRDRDIAMVYQYSRSISEEEAAANAALMSAAPDLLEALQEITAMAERWSEKGLTPTIFKAQQAINKALNR
jgi:hypothetical protein